ncbi:long-chain fatty acid--CoA ligase [Nocardiopsis sp. L17-MgMaSL7]|uniref:AMP-dependent synthetase/ligase n=1 Tax=Nocardiopsis sp. L17-MgMaSL7 TaxID=1938893 RepID=UPI000D7138A4|nr:long-chain fatty acid--CoA ligase [Nocardiopsis sp. L17-MgMaSL7]PWV54582.1 long-chain acyl-CoA synthetase [Nocardiopsis sp. L17-MgMaSL7]
MGNTSSPYRSVPDMFASRVAESGDREAFTYPVPSPTGGSETWESLTWNQTRDRVRALALGLHSLGVTSQARCAIASSTRVEWVLADLAILCAGGASTTIYPTSGPPDCAYIVSDSGSMVAFAENDEQVAKLVEQRGAMPGLSRVIAFEGAAGGDDAWVMGLAELEAVGARLHEERPELFDELVSSVRADHLATLIYTSGTTGRPKGVRLDHANWLYEAEALRVMGDEMRAQGWEMLDADDVQYLWLPLAHSFGKVMQVAQLRLGFTTAVDGRVDRIVDNLAVVRPTFMAAAPRIFEKVFNRVVMQAKEGGAARYRIFKWAVGVGDQVARSKEEGREPGGLLAAQYRVADRLVFDKLRARFGDRLKFFVSGSAPLAPEIGRFFYGAGITILEGYGLTETSAGAFLNRPGDVRFGSVGLPLPGTEVRIAEDGEVLLRGGSVMRGYHNLSGATEEVLDEDGWFATGDIGALENGRLRITDRKKELIKTAGGKYVAPQSIESRFKSLCPYVGNLVVHGDRRPYCVALVTLDAEAIEVWAEANGLGALNYLGLTREPRVRAMVQEAIDELNRGLPRHESIKDFAILPNELTVEQGEITPSLKMRRRAVEERYRDLLEGMYEGSVQKL